MKLWQKDTSIDKKIESFTIGRDAELDLFLAPFDVLGSIAHITMLESINLLEKEELETLTKSLQEIYKDAKEGKFVIEDGVEDVHSQVEKMLTEKLGDTGKKIHSGRSRNDQVLLDLRLFIREEIRLITEGVEKLFNRLIELSEQYKSVLIPGYTHFQVAMPSSFGLWFGAYAESLTDDLQLLQAAYKITNQNPLGSAAGYGSSFPLNRTMTTELLGFDDLSYNVVYAQMGRGKTEKTVAFALNSIASTLGKMAMDVTLYMNQNFGFLTFPDHLTTGSSIMPHKKNPDVFELIRARCNKIQSIATEIGMTTGNLPSGYHRDFQIMKESFFDGLQDIKTCLEITEYMLQHIIIKENIINDDRYRFIFSVEEVNKMVLGGMSFRDAYKKVGMSIEEGTYEEAKEVAHTHEGSIGNLCNEQIKAKLDKALAGFGFDTVLAAEKGLLGGE
ncbi:argininosuccinate lyase [Chondrinema litorale]|uniref:argininosuccinate lyase n=1 Tax=Chondrinema litorale TaxID=2994555 RepID=UPI00254445D6|nr:argininosuccinate lyase [Chondrinema litorale]UZR92916.1 argininosuccinate lyase [Chondrinema litorale]